MNVRKIVAIVILVWIIGAVVKMQAECNADRANCFSPSDNVPTVDEVK